MNLRRDGIFWIAALVLLAVMAAPILATLIAVAPQGVVAAFSAQAGRSALGISLSASAISITVATLLGVPAGFALARTRPAARAAALSLLALPLAFPPVASGIMLLELIGRQAPLGAALAAHGIVLVDSVSGIAIAQFFVAGSFIAITSAAAFASVDPLLEDAARTLGAGTMNVFARVSLPLAAPGIAAGIVLAWMRAIGEYGATSIVAYHPTSLPVLMYVTLSAQGIAAALALTYGFIIMGAIVLLTQWALRRRVV